MGSKVIHTRLDNETLLSCIQYYRKFSPVRNSHETAVSTAIATVLRSFMRCMREDDIIPTYDKDKVKKKLAEVLNRGKHMPSNIVRPPKFKPIIKEEDAADELTVAKPVNPAGNEPAPLPLELLQDMADSDDPRETLLNTIENSINEITQPKVEIDQSVFMPDPDDIPSPDEFIVDIETVRKYTVQEILDISPHNKLIRRAIIEENPAKLYGVLIGLKHIEPPKWSGDTAAEMCRAMRLHYRKYVEAGGKWGKISKTKWEKLRAGLPGIDRSAVDNQTDIEQPNELMGKPPED